MIAAEKPPAEPEVGYTTLRVRTLTRLRRYRPGLLVAGGIAIAVGSLLPWAEVLGVTERGVATVDGWFSLTSGCILAAIGLARPRVSVPGYIAWVATLNGAGLWAINYFDIRATEGLSVGIGMWVTLAGLMLALAGLLMGRKRA